MNDSEFLNWIADRLVHVYGESPNTSHVQKLRKMADVQLARNDADLYGAGYIVDGKRVAPQAVTVILPGKRGTQNEITDYWYKHYATDFCTLCGNSGRVDTRGVKTAAGVKVGRINFCICPNGQIKRKQQK